MPRIPEPELERLKTEVCLERLVSARGIALKKRGPISWGCARSTPTGSRRWW